MSEWEPENGRPQSNREWQLIEKMLLESHKESRRRRRWNIFFRLLVFAYLFILMVPLFSMMGNVAPSVSQQHTAVVEIKGVIAAGKPASAERIIAGLRQAFRADNSKAVMLLINSPGGSPVQASMVYQEIQRLQKKFPDKPVYAVITDMGASGAYYIAAAADKIFASPASIVGSIGVIMAGFSFGKAIDKLGIKRRLLTAGEYKGMLDPFSPLGEKAKKHINVMLERIHDQFIAAVKAERADDLVAPKKHNLFSGLFWTGARALELGLVDGLKTPTEVAREVVGAKHMVNYTVRKNPLSRLFQKFGTSIGTGIMEALGLYEVRLR